MKKVIFCLIGLMGSLSIAAPLEAKRIAVEGMEESLYIWAFPAPKLEGKSEVFVYSLRELDNLWLHIGKDTKVARLVTAPNGANKVYTYKVQETIAADEVETLSLVAYDVSTKTIIFADFGATESEKGIPYRLQKYEYTRENARQTGFQALLTETAPGSDKYHVDLLTMLSLESTQSKSGQDWVPTSAMRNFTKLDRVYRLAKPISKEEGLSFEIRAKKSDRSGFHQKITLRKDESGELRFESDTPVAVSAADVAKYEKAEADERHRKMMEKVFGGVQYSPQEIAQARANYMAYLDLGTAFHINWNGGTTSMLNGMIPSSAGPMWEGAGWSSGGDCGTCSNGKQMVAEGRAYGSRGLYKVRFFRP